MQNTIKTEEVDSAEVVVENTLNTAKIKETAAVADTDTTAAKRG